MSNISHAQVAEIEGLLKDLRATAPAAPTDDRWRTADLRALSRIVFVALSVVAPDCAATPGLTSVAVETIGVEIDQALPKMDRLPLMQPANFATASDGNIDHTPAENPAHAEPSWDTGIDDLAIRRSIIDSPPPISLKAEARPKKKAAAPPRIKLAQTRRATPHMAESRRAAGFKIFGVRVQWPFNQKS